MTTTETPTNDTAAPVAAAALLELLARYNVVDLARMPDAGPDNNELVALAERTGRPVLAAECPRPHMGNGAAGDHNGVDLRNPERACDFITDQVHEAVRAAAVPGCSCNGSEGTAALVLVAELARQVAEATR